MQCPAKRTRPLIIKGGVVISGCENCHKCISAYRFVIARLLFKEPGVVLVHEPTDNPDEHDGQGVVGLLWKLNESDAEEKLLW